MRSLPLFLLAIVAPALTEAQALRGKVFALDGKPFSAVSVAVFGDTTPSIADATSGSSNLYASISQVMSTSSGSRVRRLGTIAMSSNPYARRPVLPIPISTSTAPPECARTAGNL